MLLVVGKGNSVSCYHLCGLSCVLLKLNASYIHSGSTLGFGENIPDNRTLTDILYCSEVTVVHVSKLVGFHFRSFFSVEMVDNIAVLSVNGRKPLSDKYASAVNMLVQHFRKLRFPYKTAHALVCKCVLYHLKGNGNAAVLSLGNA